MLTHGGLLPANVALDAGSGALRGLVDWAEAEWLPFGVCLYGLEHLCGYVAAAEEGEEEGVEGVGGGGA